MEKYRLCTTISMKHFKLLKKHMETYETQQKVLEHALDIMDASAQHGRARPGEELPNPGMNGKAGGPVQKYALMMLMDTVDQAKIREYIAQVKPTVYALEYYYHKPLSECSLREIMDGLVVTSMAIGWYETTECADLGDRYQLKITHGLGLNGSKIAALANEIAFNTCGVRFETDISEKGIVHTVFKAMAGSR